MSVYLDASVLIPTLVDEASTAAVDAYFLRSDELLLVSDFAAAEVASALSRLIRTGVLEAEDAKTRLADFDVWRAGTETVDVSAVDARLANVYVRRFDLKLRAPDALHLAISSRLNVALVTLDRRLMAAARDLGVKVIEPR